jgi:hypothetical protein
LVTFAVPLVGFSAMSTISLVAVMLCGAAGSGKSTAAAALLKATPDMVELSFASRLKTICLLTGQLLMGADTAAVLTPLHFYDPALKEQPLSTGTGTSAGGAMTPRRIMQTMGTDILRAVLGPDCFVTALLEDAARAAAANQHVVISDVRFPNEADAATALRAMGFTVLRVRVDRGAVGAVRAVGAVGAVHASESFVATLPVDVVLENGGTVEDLARAVVAVFGGALACAHRTSLDP